MTEESESIRNGINDAAIHSFNYRRNQLDKTSSTELNLNGVLASNSKQNNNGSSLGGRLQFFKGKMKKITFSNYLTFFFCLFMFEWLLWINQNLFLFFRC